MDIDIIITTHGEQRWAQLAYDVAAQSACQQAVTHLFHADECVSLGDARNQAVDNVDPQGYICFLDADDELQPGYMTAMKKAIAENPGDRLFVPALKLGHSPARCLTERNIDVMNPCPIGTLIHRDMFERVGGFWDEPAWEDWSLFRRAWSIGANLVFVPDAVYRANSTRSGRNAAVRQPKLLLQQIRDSHAEWANA